MFSFSPVYRLLPVYALFCSTAAFADTIVSTLGAGNTYNGTIGGPTISGADTEYDATAQFFTSSGNFAVTQIDIALVSLDGTNSAAVSLWTDSAGQPGAQLGSWVASPFPASSSLSSATTSLSGGQMITGITGVQLLSGQSYFLEAAPGAPDTDLFWYQQTAAPGSGVYSTGSPSGPWVSEAGSPDGAYAVFGNTVSAPEPASILLALAGLAAIGFLRRRRSDPLQL